MTSAVGQQVTPVILTHNEELNIGRALASLTWAENVFIVDSGSTDGTKSIAGGYENVRWFVRPFDSIKDQWQYSIRELAIPTQYILALDADMYPSQKFLDEVESRFLPGRFTGGLIPFRYCYYGRPLAGSLCSPQLRIFDQKRVLITQPAHGHRFSVTGEIYKFHNSLSHDDRKPIERWVTAQIGSSQLNADALSNVGTTSFKDRLRRLGVTPPLVGMMAYVRAGGPFKGAAAARYAYERMVAEGLLAIRLMDKKVERAAKHESQSLDRQSERNEKC